jgi:hypothetical protein
MGEAIMAGRRRRFIAAYGIAVAALAAYGVRPRMLWAWTRAVIVPVLGLAVALPAHYPNVFDTIGHLALIYVDTALFIVGALLALGGLGHPAERRNSDMAIDDKVVIGQSHGNDDPESVLVGYLIDVEALRAGKPPSLPNGVDRSSPARCASTPDTSKTPTGSQEPRSRNARALRLHRRRRPHLHLLVGELARSGPPDGAVAGPAIAFRSSTDQR